MRKNTSFFSTSRSQSDSDNLTNHYIMKKITLLLFALPAIVNVQAQGVLAYANSPATQAKAFSVKGVSRIPWDAKNGLAYKEVQGANLGATSFAMMNNNRTAFLSDASNEIVITNDWNGQVLSRFPVALYPRDFAFDKGKFYVLTENMVTVYDVTGKQVNAIPFPGSYLGVMRLTRYNNATYLLLPSGNSVEIEANGAATQAIGHKGWITSAGNFVGTRLAGDNNYDVKIILANGNSYQKTFTADKKVGGVYVIGATATRIYIDVQTFVSESPVQVERHIVAIELNAGGLGNLVSSTKLPDSYYVLSDKDIEVEASGELLNMVTNAQGANVFSLTETNADQAQDYPASITAVKYHFNDHMVKENQTQK
jgi:hypothetical protein